MRNPPLSRTRAVTASLFSRNSRKTESSSWMSSSMSWGRVAMSCVLRYARVDKLVQQHASDHVERLKDTFAFVSGSAEGRHLHFAIVQQELHVLGRRGVGQVALVVLDDVGNIFQIELQALQIVREVLQTFHILR